MFSSLLHRAPSASPPPPQPVVLADMTFSDHVAIDPPPHFEQVRRDEYPAMAIGFGAGQANCGDGCAAMIASARGSFREYINMPGLADGMLPRRYLPMVVAMDDRFSFPDWEQALRRYSGGERLREKARAERQGYYAKRFAWELHLPDIHEINHSRPVRSGGEMRGSYRRTLEEMGGAPTRHWAVQDPACNFHWTGQTFGVFQPIEGYRQGLIVTDEKLVGYVSLSRYGDLAVYSMILGHGDHLKAGIMVLLHHHVIEWLAAHRETFAKGLKLVMYGGVENGGQSLYQWKRRSGFKPCRLVAKPDPVAALMAPPACSPADYLLARHSSVDSYVAMTRRLLETFPRSETHATAWAEKLGGDDLFLLRHDVDHDLERAVGMARIDAALGIRASFYLLHPGDYGSLENYYGRFDGKRIVHNPRLFEAAREIAGLGQEIGLHNDFLYLSLRTGIPVRDLIAREMEAFDRAGLPIRGTCSHGSAFARENGIANYAIFSDRTAGKPLDIEIALGERRQRIPCVSMAELGLEYEAYDLQTRWRMSDVGGRLLMTRGPGIWPSDFARGRFSGFSLEGGGGLVSLIHADHWQTAEELREKEAAVATKAARKAAVRRWKRWFSAARLRALAGFLRAPHRPLRKAWRTWRKARRVAAGAAGLPVFALSYGQGRPDCIGGCAGAVAAAQDRLGGLVDHGGGWRNRVTGVPMVIDWAEMAGGREDVAAGLPAVSERVAGFAVRPFVFRQFAPDIAEIDRSQHGHGQFLRTAPPRTVAELGGEPAVTQAPAMPVCPDHWNLALGLFEPAPGRRQGAVVTDARLAAYVSLRRFGDIVVYAQFSAHAKDFDEGAAWALHAGTLRWLAQHAETHARGLRLIMFGGAPARAGEGFDLKTPLGFRPARLTASAGDGNAA